MNELARIQALRENDRKLYGRINPLTDVEGSLSAVVQDTRQNLNTALLNNQKEFAQEQEAPVQNPTQPAPEQTVETTELREGNIPVVTQGFGNKSGIEKFSGGVNLGTDFGVKRGTPLGLPPGKWAVVDAFTGAKEGDRSANKGSGNMVKVVNVETGEMLAFEHLDTVGVAPGVVYNGGTIIGRSGNTGNSTGPHASIPYKNAQGQYRDVLSSPYTKYIFGAGGGSGFMDYLLKD